jgi:hypothetical protein
MSLLSIVHRRQNRCDPKKETAERLNKVETPGLFPPEQPFLGRGKVGTQDKNCLPLMLRSTNPRLDARLYSAP